MEQEVDKVAELAEKYNIIEREPGILVGISNKQELATQHPEAYKDVEYLYEEFDFIYIDEKQYKDLKKVS